LSYLILVHARIALPRLEARTVARFLGGAVVRGRRRRHRSASRSRCLWKHRTDCPGLTLGRRAAFAHHRRKFSRRPLGGFAPICGLASEIVLNQLAAPLGALPALRFIQRCRLAPQFRQRAAPGAPRVLEAGPILRRKRHFDGGAFALDPPALAITRLGPGASREADHAGEQQTASPPEMALHVSEVSTLRRGRFR
jgi:hypothetical protein